MSPANAGHAGVDQADVARGRVERQAQHGLQQEERRAGRPRLRRAGDGIERRAAPGPAREAAEQLGQCGADPCSSAASNRPRTSRSTPRLEAVAREAQRDQRVVVRPDRAVVIGHRVVARLAHGDGADAPAGEDIGAAAARGDAPRAVRPRDAGEQAHGPALEVRTRHGRLVAVERQRVGADLLAPERLLEALAQRARASRLELRGALGHAQRARAARRPARLAA